MTDRRSSPPQAGNCHRDSNASISSDRPVTASEASSLTVIRAIARAEYGQFEHRHTSTRRKKALGYVLLALLLPIFGMLLWGSYGVGRTVGSGDATALLDVARWYLPAMIGVYVLYGATEATKRLVGFEARELVLTAVHDRNLVFGLLVADFRKLVWALVVPTACFAVAFAVGAGSPTVAVSATVAALALTISSLLVGYVFGIAVRGALQRASISSRLRAALGGLSTVAVTVLFAAGGAVLGGAGAEISLDDAASLEALAPDGPTPIPIGYYADLFFVGTPAFEGLSLDSVASAVAVVAAIPLSLRALVVLTPRLWYADPSATLEEEPNADATSQPADSTTDRAAGLELDRATGRADRRDWPWLATQIGSVADGIVRRSVRTPRRLTHLLYYAIGLGYAVAVSIVEPALAPTLLGGGLALAGLWLAGGAVCLNPLGEEGSMLEQLALAMYAPATFVRARLLVGTLLGIPFVLAGTALLALRTLSAPDAVLVGGFWLLSLPASACFALGIGTLLPKSEPGRVLERIDARPPEKLAILVHAVMITLLAVVGAFLLVSEASASLRWGGFTVVALLTLLIADAGYRFAVSGLADYGRPRRPDSIYALELAIGLGLLGLVLSVTVAEGALLGLEAVPVSIPTAAAFVVAFVASYVGWAVAGAASLLASGRSREYLDVEMPAASDLRYLVAGLIGSLGVYAAIVGVTAFLDAPFVAHSIADEVVAGGPAFVLVLVALVFLVNAPVEEFLFRNVIQKRLAEAVPERWAIIGAAVVFAGVHLPVYLDSSPVAVAVTLTPLVVLGAIWGWVYARTETLLVPILCHGTYNAVVFGVLYVTVLS